MPEDSFFVLTCVSMIALLFGSMLAFSGYRFFMFILPIWGFFFGFGLGAQAIQAILGSSFLGDVTSWVVGFVVALLFAALSYFFYTFAVAVVSGSLGYSVGVGIMLSILPNLNLIAWLVGIVFGVIFAFIVVAANIQKLIVIIATALQGAGIIVGTFLLVAGQLPSSEVVDNPVRSVLQASPLWMIIFIVVVLLGVASQLTTTRSWQVETYQRV